jgi:hypothetical protein
MVGLIVTLAMVLPTELAAKSRAQETTGLARVLFDFANKERTTHGLAELKWDDRLAAAAQGHAQRMAEKNTLSHQFPGEADPTTRARQAGALFSKIAENVALASSINVIHENWMNSPSHRANILDKELDSVGIAVAERNGVLFAVQDFSRAVETLSLESQETKIGSLLASRGIRLLNNIPSETAMARKQCALESGTPGRHRPVLVFRFTTTDLSQLPEALAQKIQSGRYRSAAVGACAPDKRSPFTNYRLAVLLY